MKHIIKHFDSYWAAYFLLGIATAIFLLGTLP